MLPRAIFASRHGADTRQQLVDANIALVHHVARQVTRSLDADIDPDELVGAGALGLMSAADAFDVSRGLAFSTFAIPRIRGAMLDELRRQAPSSRSTRRKARAIASARSQIAGSKGGHATAREMADALGVDLSTFWQWERDVDGSIQIPLSHVDEESESAVPLLDMVAATDADDLESRLTRERQVEAMKHAILELNESERIVITLNYYEELRLREIAEVLELTESRVSQIRTRALAKLRKALAAYR